MMEGGDRGDGTGRDGTDCSLPTYHAFFICSFLSFLCTSGWIWVFWLKRVWGWDGGCIGLVWERRPSSSLILLGLLIHSFICRCTSPGLSSLCSAPTSTEINRWFYIVMGGDWEREEEYHSTYRN